MIAYALLTFKNKNNLKLHSSTNILFILWNYCHRECYRIDRFPVYTIRDSFSFFLSKWIGTNAFITAKIQSKIFILLCMRLCKCVYLLIPSIRYYNPDPNVLPHTIFLFYFLLSIASPFAVCIAMLFSWNEMEWITDGFFLQTRFVVECMFVNETFFFFIFKLKSFSIG